MNVVFAAFCLVAESFIERKTNCIASYNGFIMNPWISFGVAVAAAAYLTWCYPFFCASDNFYQIFAVKLTTKRINLANFNAILLCTLWVFRLVAQLKWTQCDIQLERKDEDDKQTNTHQKKKEKKENRERESPRNFHFNPAKTQFNKNKDRDRKRHCKIFIR